MAGWEEAWVVAADTDNVALTALILARSLRRTMTSKKMLICIGPSVSKERRKQLQQVFDSVLLIDCGMAIKKGVTNETFGKMFCMNLTLIKKCIYLNPNVMIIHNLDFLFKSYETGVKSGDGKNALLLAVFSPSVENFEDMMDAGKTFEQWILENNSITVDGKYFGGVDFNGAYHLEYVVSIKMNPNIKCCIDRNNPEISLVQFTGTHPTDLIKKNGIAFVPKNLTEFEANILSFWKEMYYEVKHNILTEHIPNSVTNKEPIAIIGMACRLPGANNTDEFWNLMMNKKDAIIPTPDTRWTKEQFPNVTDEERNVQAGFLKCPVDEFDGKFFGMSPLELSFADPQQRLLLEVVWEALENAGTDPTSLKETRTSVFTGTWTNDYRDSLSEAGHLKSEMYRTYMGNSFGASAGRIAHFLGTSGSNIATESGCSSSIVAVGLACKSLRDNEANVSLACGVNLLLHPFKFNDMSFILSGDGRCKTFDKDADGFGRAEGCGVLVLKRLSDAVHDNDIILALIRGYGQTQEGCSTSMGTPTVKCESLAMNLALQNAGVKPCEVSFVETHGTGTPVGDPMEMAAIAQVYSKERQEPMVVGSVKSNIGHTESCSGIAGIIKTVLSLQNEFIPPHIGCKTLNPRIDLGTIPAIIPMEATPWKRMNGKRRIAGVSSFGITGTDAHLIIQEAPDKNKSTVVKTSLLKKLPLNILTISAKSEEAFNQLLENYRDPLQQNALSDIAFTANTGRAHLLPYRGAIIASSCAEIINNINKDAIIKPKEFAEKPKVAFVFTGQGGQYHKMGKQLYNTFPIFRKHFDYCIKILDSYEISIKEVIWGEEANPMINEAKYSQPGVFCVEYATFKLWESWGIKPEMVAGHSLGEFAATTAAGIWSVEDALKVLATRTHLLETLAEGKMLVVQTDDKTTTQLLKQLEGKNNFWLDIACINSLTQTVLAGEENCIKLFAELCKNNNIKTQEVYSNRGYHSRQMDPILPKYKKVLQSVEFSEQTCDFISGNSGKRLEGRMTPEYWLQHLRDTVRFRDASVTMYEMGARICLDTSPHPIAASLFATNVETIQDKELILCVPSMRKGEDDLKVILNAMGTMYCNGFDVNWQKFHKYFTGKKITLPSYPFTRKKHWFDVSGVNRSAVMGSGKELHPLVGFPLSNATSHKIFQSLIQCASEKYLLDHMIGKYVIFPGAGYVEICLAAGYASILASFEDFELPTTPLTVKNVRIEMPLELNVENGNKLQIVVSPSDEEESGFKRVNIYQHHGDETETKKWMSHATAAVSLVDYSTHLYQKTDLDISSINEQEGWSHTEKNLDVFYDQLATLGLKFGPTFRSLKQLWRHESGEIVAQVSVPLSSSVADKFLCHPVLIDSMIQTIMLQQYKEQEMKLCVPICINLFTWFAKYKTEINYIRVGNDKEARLYGEDGKLLAIMSGAQIIETDLESIVRAVESQKVCLPQIYDEVWRPNATLGMSDPDSGFRNKVLHTLNEELAKLQETYACSKTNLDKLSTTNTAISFGVICGLHQLGWDYAKQGDVVQVDRFIKKCGILPQNRLMFRRFLEMLQEDGYLVEQLPFEFRAVKDLPSHKEAQEMIEKVRASGDADLEMEFPLSCLEKMALVLQGKETVLQILFPEEDAQISAEVIYKESSLCKRLNSLLSASLEMLVETQLKTLGRELKILEIGAGTGSATSIALPILRKHKINFSYTFTDLSTMFFIKAEKHFEQFSKELKYKILNIDNDPVTQGFSPCEFDLIICSNVLHATVNMTQTIRNTRMLLKNRGLVLILEMLKPHRPTDATFGLLEGYWRFSDFHLRPYHTLIDDCKWSELLARTGFSSNSTVNIVGDGAGLVVGEASDEIFQYTCPSGNKQKLWILFGPPSKFREDLQHYLKLTDRVTCTVEYDSKQGKVSDLSYKVQPDTMEDFKVVFEELQNMKKVEIEGVLYLWGLEVNSQQEVVAQGLLNLMKSFTATINTSVSSPKFILVTEGALYTEDQEPTAPTSATLWGMAKSFSGENLNFHVKSIDVEPDAPLRSKVQQIFTEMWRDNVEMSIAYRNQVRHHRRCVATKFSQVPLSLPNAERFSLVLPSTKSISDLKFSIVPRQELTLKEIEIKVKAASLNFRDVLSVIKPIAEFENSNSVGGDFAGIITAVGSEVTRWKIGDSVLGCNFIAAALPTHVKLPENAVVALPRTMTYAEGSTLTVVFATAYHCLITVGKLQKNEIILIHTASGAVGICAIQIARDIGATIIATAGSKRKRAFLRNVMGLEHVFHSRNLTFGSSIQEVTEGKGVHMILNSLTGPGFKETSLSALRPKGRFVEMSKLNIWTELQVKEMREDVEYTIVDLTKESESTWQDIFFNLNARLTQRKIKPIPYTSFEAVYIRDALTYLQKAKHIGKVVCVMPETFTENGDVVAKTDLFNDRSTYLITGGLGGIGIEVTKWMASLGAQNILLLGRNQPNEKAAQVISTLTLAGKNIIVMQGDVGKLDDCEKTLNFIKDPMNNLPPLRGIMHVAGCLSDALIVNQTWEKYETCFNSKVKGSWNLHFLTKDYQLEHFVMYSSVAAIVGSMGQSNHASANSYLDALAQYRVASGLPSTSVNWGQWGQVGVVADSDLLAISAFTPLQAFNALELIMKSHKTRASVVEIDIPLCTQFNPTLKPYFSEIRAKTGRGSDTKKCSLITPEKFWADFDAADEEEAKRKIMQNCLIEVISNILRLQEGDNVDVSQTFQEMGLDSLMMVELKNVLQVLFGSKLTLSASEISDCNTVNLLTNRLMELIRGTSGQTKEDYLDKLVEQDCILPEHIQAVGENAVDVGDIKTVLLLGSTGNLGSHVLQLLSQTPQIIKIVCIVRGKDENAGREKLMENLAQRGILSNVVMNKVQILPGNIAVTKFGLEDDELYETLTKEVDAVLNCAVKAHHQEEYRKTVDETSDVRSINVLGTLHTLEFASTHKTKWVYHASTMAYLSEAESNICPETWPEASDYEKCKATGYLLSKFIGDRLVGQAVERGIPCKAFRFPYLAGDSRTGHVSIQDNHVLLRFIAYMKMRAMPSLPLPLILIAVDTAAQISLQVFLQQLDLAPLGLYNVTNPRNQFEHEFLHVSADLGYPIEIMEFDDFANRVNEEGETSPLYQLRDVYLNKEKLQESLENASALHQWFMNPAEFYVSKKLMKAVPKLYLDVELPTEVLARDLKWAKSKGLLSKFGL